MRIAADIRLWQNDYVHHVLPPLMEEHSEHHFILLTAKAFPAFVQLPSNISTVFLTPNPANFLSFKWWYDVKLTAALKKCKADVFVGMSGLLSLRTNIPQVLFVQDLSYLVNPAFFYGKGLFFYKKYTGAFAKKATAIAAVSAFVKQQLVDACKADENKMTVIGGGVNEVYQPISCQQREKVKEQYADGCEYFIFNGELGARINFISLLKAFSIFKKWQKTNMKLVITGTAAFSFDKQLTKLDTYKYKSEVVLRLNVDETEKAKLIAAAYALVYPFLYEGFATPVLAAMQCEVPVITSANSSIEEIAGDAALYADATNPEEVAGQMKLLFKDEKLRSKMIETGKQRSSMYSYTKASNELWSVIKKAFSA